VSLISFRCSFIKTYAHTHKTVEEFGKKKKSKKKKKLELSDDEEDNNNNETTNENNQNGVKDKNRANNSK